MTTKLNERKPKNDFIAKTRQRIEARELILKFYNEVYLPTLLKFDGKVYNKRFITALRDKCKEYHEFMHVTEKSYDHIEIQLRTDRWNYNDYESMYVKCETEYVDGNNRISYGKTVNDQFHKAWVENFAKYCGEYEDAIANYDKYMETVKALENALQAYSELPHAFRANIDTDYARIY